MKSLSILLALSLTACVGAYNISTKLEVAPGLLPQINALYSPWSEKAFCVSKTQIYNILEGGWMSVEAPICLPEDIQFHTHPWWAESFPNFIDLGSWEDSWKLHRMKNFGIMLGEDSFRIYERK